MMMSDNALQFGEIVLLKFPFTSGGKLKKRPALILFDCGDEDVIVCRITSKLYDTEFDFRIEGWKKAGLKLPSVIRIHKIATLGKDLIYKKIGRINKHLTEDIKTKYQTSLQ